MRKRDLKIADLLRITGGSQSYLSNYLNNRNIHGKIRGISLVKADELLTALDSDFGQFQKFLDGDHVYEWDHCNMCWIEKTTKCDCCGVTLADFPTFEMVQRFISDGFVGDMTRDCASDMSDLLELLNVEHVAEVDLNVKNNNFCDNSGHVCLKKVV